MTCERLQVAQASERCQIAQISEEGRAVAIQNPHAAGGWAEERTTTYGYTTWWSFKIQKQLNSDDNDTSSPCRFPAFHRLRRGAGNPCDHGT